MTPTHSKENPPAQQAWAARQPCMAGGEAGLRAGGEGEYVLDMENSLTGARPHDTAPRPGSKHPLVSGALPCRPKLLRSDNWRSAVCLRSHHGPDALGRPSGSLSRAGAVPGSAAAAHSCLTLCGHILGEGAPGQAACRRQAPSTTNRNRSRGFSPLCVFRDHQA